jgi:hypothetical protein
MLGFGGARSNKKMVYQCETPHLTPTLSAPSGGEGEDPVCSFHLQRVGRRPVWNSH